MHQVLETIAWLKDLFQPIEQQLLGLHRLFFETGALKSTKSLDPLLQMLHHSGKIVDAIKNNPNAIKVLNAFSLSQLYDPEFYTTYLARVIAMEGAKAIDDGGGNTIYHGTVKPWEQMVGCIKPLVTLVIPPQLQDKAQPEIFSIELSERPELVSEVVTEVIKATTTLYETIAKSTSHRGLPPLTVLKIESGTGLTISFKGVADVVKETKNFFIEMWNKHRHKRADEIINHNRAVASSIQLLIYLDEQVKQRALQPEDGERLKRALVSNTLTLFKDGALLTDIPTIEIVDNSRLIDGFHSPALLNAPIETEPDVIQPAVTDKAASEHTQQKPGRKKTQAKKVSRKKVN